MSKKTGRMAGKGPADALVNNRTGQPGTQGKPGGVRASARRTSPDNATAGTSPGGKVSGTKFNPGAGKPAAKTGPVAPAGGWNTWDDDAAGDDEFGAGRRQDAMPEPVAPVSPEVVSQLRREAQQSLVRSVAATWSVSVVVALIALAVGGKAAGLSALLGAAASALPNSLLAMRLLLNSLKPGGGSGVTALVGEFVKLGATVLLLVLVVKLGGALIVWPALLAGLIAALKSYWVMLAWDSIQRKGP
jgi:ATP synthase protein I